MNSALLPKLAEAEAEVRRLTVTTAPDVLGDLVMVGDPAEVARRWDGMDVNRRRAILHSMGVRVTLLPTRRGPGFDRDSVRVEYRD